MILQYCLQFLKYGFGIMIVLLQIFPQWGTPWIFPLFLLFVMCFLTLTGRAMEWRQNQYVLWNSQLYRPRGSPWRGLWYC